MSTANLQHFMRCGLPGVDYVPAGMHACHFYSSRDQLVEALVPYFATGLRENERCLWITAPPLPAEEAARALRTSYDGVDAAIEAGALRIRDFDQWHSGSQAPKGTDVIQLWLDEEQRALSEGYSGLRITGNTSFLKPAEWSTFMEYEQALSANFKGRRIVALCCYARAQCQEHRVMEVMSAHHFAFEGPDTFGQVVAIPQSPKESGLP